ncbi:MAG: BTAD domain-containing putative transcriptional regulator [Acidimicrobiales bacterium]
MQNEAWKGEPVLRYDLLGRLRVRLGDDEIQLGARKERALLAMLLANANHVVSTDQLIDELWANGASKQPQNVLWVNISKLRSALDPDRPKGANSTVVVTSSPGYMLVTDPDAIDAKRFESLTEEGRRLLDVDPAAASLVFHEALALWKGRAFEEFVYDEFAQTEIARLEELRLAAVEDRIDADLRSGSTRELVSELESLTRLNPLRERLAAHMMVALHRSGRQGEALRAFGTYRRTLRDELGLDPSADLSALEERIVLDDPTLSLGERVLVSAGSAPTAATVAGVRGHELRERIGVGPRGVVHTVYEPSAGRELALKVIRPEIADDPEFIRQFDTETQLAQALDHPRIVATIDRWRQPGAAYVTMPLFTKGSLQAALERAELSLDDALRVIDHVAEALGAAHRLGVVHGNLKPTNILLDTDGNASVADFAMSASMLPTPFAAPEQQTGAEATERSDTFSLAMIAQHVVRSVDADAANAAPVAAVLARGSDADRLSRYDGPERFAHHLREAFGHGPGVPLAARIENPYVGLQAFQERDAGRFFGRERLVERIVARLGAAGVQGRLIVLVGPSGAGKSSVVRAGVLPAVRRDAIGDADQWFHATMTPGNDPFASLALALRSVAVQDTPGLAEHLRLEGITGPTARLLPEPDAHLLLLVDQLEELFTHSSAEDADAFLDALAAVADDAHSPIKIIATLRADHYERPLRHQAFGELLRHSSELITPMTAAELEQATVAPAAAAGVTFEAGLVPEIVSDVMGQASALPLLQHALTELFEHRVGTSIDAAAYLAIGGVAGALVQTAENVHDGFEDQARTQIRDVFLRLVSLGDGTPVTRRRVLVKELTGPGASHAPDILDTFGRHRLLSFDHDPVTRSATVEIAHESLLTEWRRLAEWIDHTRVDVQAQRSLNRFAATWREHDEDPAFLLPEGQTDRYAGWIDRPPLRLTAAERGFLASSVAAVSASRHADVHRLRRLRRLVTATGIALVVALIAGGVALSQRNNAQASAADAELATLISTSAAQAVDNPELAILLALEANRRAPGTATERAVLNAVGSSTIPNRISSTPLQLREGEECQIVRSASGELVVTGLFEGRLATRDNLTLEITVYDEPPAPCVEWDLDPATGHRWARTPDGASLWSSPAGGTWTEIQIDAPVLMESGITPSQQVLFGTFIDGAPAGVLLNVVTGELVGEPIFSEGTPTQHQLSRDGSRLAVASLFPEDGSGLIRIVDTESGLELSRIQTDAAISKLSFDDAASELMAAGFDNVITTFDLDSGDIVGTVKTLATSRVVDMEVRPDGLLLVVSAGQAEILDRRSGPIGDPIELRNVTQSVISPNGHITTLTANNRLETFDLTGSALVTVSHVVDRLARTHFTPGWVGAVEIPNAPSVINLTTGERTSAPLVDPELGLLAPLAVNPDETGLWMIGFENQVTRWEDGAIAATIDLDGDQAAEKTNALFGNRLGLIAAELGQDSDAYLIDLASGTPQVLFSVSYPAIQAVHPSPNGGLFVLDEEGLLRTIDPEGREQSAFDTGIPFASTITIDETTGRLAVGGGTGAFIIDLATEDTRGLAQSGDVGNVAFARGGEVLVVTTFDGTVRIWDVDGGGLPTFVWDGSGSVRGSSPSWYDEASDSVWVASSGRVLQIPLDPEQWIKRACEIVSRDLTQVEWDRLVPGDGPLQPACG